MMDLLDTADLLDEVHTVDCISAMKQMRPHIIDCTILDPPFSVALGNNKSVFGGKLDMWHDLMNASYFFQTLFEQIKRVNKEDSFIWCFSSWKSYPSMAAGIYKAGLSPTSVLIWDKQWIGVENQGLRPRYELVILICTGSARIPNRSASDIIECKWTANKPNHPAEKPIALVEYLLEVSGFPEVVLDPFCGSGTVPLAAKRNGLRFIAFDVNPEYVRLSRVRLTQTTLGKSPLRELKGLQEFIEEEG